MTNCYHSNHPTKWPLRCQGFVQKSSMQVKSLYSLTNGPSLQYTAKTTHATKRSCDSVVIHQQKRLRWKIHRQITENGIFFAFLTPLVVKILKTKSSVAATILAAMLHPPTIPGKVNNHHLATGLQETTKVKQKSYYGKPEIRPHHPSSAGWLRGSSTQMSSFIKNGYAISETSGDDLFPLPLQTVSPHIHAAYCLVTITSKKSVVFSSQVWRQLVTRLLT